MPEGTRGRARRTADGRPDGGVASDGAEGCPRRRADNATAEGSLLRWG
jgi:hypothetical protein